MSVKYANRKFKISRLRYRGILDMDGLYKMMQGWFGDRGFYFLERRFKKKERAEGEEWEINWEAWREVNDFIKNWIEIYFHVWDYKEIEVIKDGKKQRLGQCRLLIDFNFYLELDYDDFWEDRAFKRMLRTVYIKYVIRHDLNDVWWDKLWYNTNKLQQATKQFLGMSSHSDVYDDMW